VHLRFQIPFFNFFYIGKRKPGAAAKSAVSEQSTHSAAGPKPGEPVESDKAGDKAGGSGESYEDGRRHYPVTVRKLLGHKCVETSMIYLHVMEDDSAEKASPLDGLCGLKPAT